ncbi:N-acetylmuramoyl-L-alanine amidase [Cryptosporangium sp. NPDC048952]|uniref:N-acetylmuramoyl-L-alanine amidase n=1 Tax=Cryptosporangium sp. NPDC048952 TaxID=3363961 RepID=UPI00371ECEE6
MRQSRRTGRTFLASGMVAAATLAAGVLTPATEATATTRAAPAHVAAAADTAADAARGTGAAVGSAGDGVVRVARRLRVGSAGAPTGGARGLAVQPVGVPLADGHELAVDGTARVLRAATAGVRFAAVGVTWRRDVALGEVSVAVRTKASGTPKWSPWTTNEYHGANNRAGRTGPGLIWTGDAEAIDVVLTGVSGRSPKDVTLDLLDPGSNPVTFRGLPAAARQPTRYGNGVVQIFSRSAWGASTAYMRKRPRYASSLKAVVLHHTATTNNYSADDVPRIIRSIYYYMSVTEKYGDIGYNVLVDKYGRLWEGRAGGLDRPVIGIHAGGFNTGTSGIAIIGNHDKQPISAAAREAVARYAAFKLGRYGVDPLSTQRITGGPSTRYKKRTTVRIPAISPHRETSRTACPGDEGLAILPGVRTRTKALIGRYHLDPRSRT